MHTLWKIQIFIYSQINNCPSCSQSQTALRDVFSRLIKLSFVHVFLKHGWENCWRFMIEQLPGVLFFSNSFQSGRRPRIQYNSLGMWFYYRSSMFNEEGKLIVIHEYQPPEFSPFLNPICKNTYNALPKIYGHTRKRKYLLFPLTTKHSQDNRCLRDCCEHRYEYERSRTDVKQLKAKMKVDPLLS